MPANNTPASLIPNTAPAIRAVFQPADGEPYTLPVVAWTDGHQALAPSLKGHLFRVNRDRDFVRLERDMQFTDDAQEAMEEGLDERLATEGDQPYPQNPETPRPQPTTSW